METPSDGTGVHQFCIISVEPRQLMPNAPMGIQTPLETETEHLTSRTRPCMPHPAAWGPWAQGVSPPCYVESVLPGSMGLSMPCSAVHHKNFDVTLTGLSTANPFPCVLPLIFLFLIPWAPRLTQTTGNPAWGPCGQEVAPPGHGKSHRQAASSTGTLRPGSCTPCTCGDPRPASWHSASSH